METSEASDPKAYPTCKICDRGTLTPRKIRRLSGPAVAIGYILAIPSILGIAVCAILLVVSLLSGVAGAAHGSAFATAFAGIGAVVFVYIGIFCFVSGLVGWLLIMKKHVLQCDNCGAVVDAARAVHSQPNRNFGRAREFGFFFLFLTLVITIVFTHKSGTWKPFTSADGRFSILFPGTPQQLKEPGSHVHGFSSSPDKGHSIYMVESVDLRPDIGPEAVPQAILGVEEKQEIAGSLLIKDKVIDLHGVPGRAFEAVDPSGNSGFVREFFTWPYVYIVTAIARKGYTAPYANEFLDSFRILDNLHTTTTATATVPTQPGQHNSAAESPAGTLVRVFPTCQFGAILGELCKPVWKRIEADNGEVTWIDMHSISQTLPRRVWVYTSVPNTAQDPDDMSMLTFDCQGHFMSVGGPIMDAPPRSVAGEIAATVCRDPDSSGGRP